MSALSHEWSPQRDSEAAGNGDWDAVIFRSAVDAKVWMCNIPDTDVETGIQSSTSVRKLKRYVEETLAPDIVPGAWRLSGAGVWEFFGEIPA